MPGIYFNVLERKTDSQQMLWLFHTDLKEICILQKLTQPEPLFSSPLKFFLSPHLPEELKKTYQFWGENICRTRTGNEILQAVVSTRLYVLSFVTLFYRTTYMGKQFPFSLSQLGQTCPSIHKIPVLQKRAEVYMQTTSDLTEKETRPEKFWCSMLLAFPKLERLDEVVAVGTQSCTHRINFGYIQGVV